MKQTLGVIGGSGLYDLEGLEDVREESLATPYGAPSDVVVSGTLGDTRLLFLPRHGRVGTVSPRTPSTFARTYARSSCWAPLTS